MTYPGGIIQRDSIIIVSYQGEFNRHEIRNLDENFSDPISVHS